MGGTGTQVSINQIWDLFPSGEYGAQHTDYVLVPSNKCGLVIGKGGETIKQVRKRKDNNIGIQRYMNTIVTKISH